MNNILPLTDRAEYSKDYIHNLKEWIRAFRAEKTQARKQSQARKNHSTYRE